MNHRAVVLFHGYSSSPMNMKSISYYIKKTGLFRQTIEITTYSSPFGMRLSNYSLLDPIIHIPDNKLEIKNSLTEHALNQLKEKIEENISELYFIAHSMGGLLCRSLLKSVIMKDKQNWLRSGNSPQVKVLILLSTPNQGTKLVNLKPIQFYSKLHLKFYEYLVSPLRSIGITMLNLILYPISKQIHPIHKQKLLISQIDAMKPDSQLIQWLNKSPTFVNEIPHYHCSGTKNRYIFTNRAWKEKVDGKTRKIPNDGVVSIEESKLAGSKEIELGKSQSKITHYGICSWWLPFKHYKVVRDRVISVLINHIN